MIDCFTLQLLCPYAYDWFRISDKHISPLGRAGLVATHSIAQDKNKAASIDVILSNGGYIHEAVSRQPWPGDAAVHVSLVNWCYQKPKVYYLDNKPVNEINSKLKPDIDLKEAKIISSNKSLCFRGVEPNGKGFIISLEQAAKWIESDAHNSFILKKYSMGMNLATNPHGTPDRYIIDFNEMAFENAIQYKEIIEDVRVHVKEKIRDKKKEKNLREKWWIFKRVNKPLRVELSKINFCFASPRVGKWLIPILVPTNWLPGEKHVSFTTDDFYILGILLSKTSNLLPRNKQEKQ